MAATFINVPQQRFHRYDPPDVRFLGRVVCDLATRCWMWLGRIDRQGYGAFTIGGRRCLAHRWGFERFREQVEEGLDLDHLCRTTACVNPAHLEPVTHRENVLRGVSIVARYARATHCKNGHPWVTATTGVRRERGRVLGRRCYACLRERRQLRQGRDRVRAAITAEALRQLRAELGR